MAEITASLIKELRTLTGSGMVDCKKALEETNGSIEEAVDILRKKGLASAAKKSGRVTSEGLVCVKQNENKAVVIEVNSETDFVAKNEQFIEFVNKVAELSLNEDYNSETILESKFDESSLVKDALSNAIATIGENIQIRRIGYMEKPKDGLFTYYIHNKTNSEMGKIAVLVSYKGQPKNPEIAEQIAMHIASTSPKSLSKEDLDPSIVEREKNVQLDLIAQSGKPAEIAEKMLVGRINKLYEEVCLLEQSFFLETDKKVKQILADNSIEINSFVCYVLGEGVEKQEEDFAEEVAKIAQA